MIEKLKKLNEDIINNHQNDESICDKHILIRKMLEDDKCFFKMNIEQAYALLRELNISEENLKMIYSELIDSSNYK